ncbi:hypothetical protein QC764_502200 [Podospora pseudoanserina]|uniref:EVE domain-containing protein n=1 Tax=Podospora pseudoanserina TaxID=2609844 RepID=A0ABR0I3N0_9PEZI|nr:hypothetical protein QC764_502200 [Podospora pseudoanserina]
MVPKGRATSRVACAPWWLSLAWHGPGLSQRPSKFPIRSDRPPSSHTTKVNFSGFAAVRFASAASTMPKRKSTHAEEPAVAAPEPRRRSMRLQRTEDETEPKAVKNEKASKADIKTEEDEPSTKKSRTSKQETEPVVNKSSPPAKKATKKAVKREEVEEASPSPAPDESEEKNYWLLKAEPESRYENGVDVKFSIDDLAAKTEPEPWDGIRNYAARNNLRAMKKGDLAFFYHSNCKEPGIVGTMEIVKEHSPDLSAHDPKAPYYDPKSKPSDPKWSVVHVKFHEKFNKPITLKELRELGAPGGPLDKMQMIKQSRLSVSKVSASEWKFLMAVAERGSRP